MFKLLSSPVYKGQVPKKENIKNSNDFVHLFTKDKFRAPLDGGILVFQLELHHLRAATMGVFLCFLRKMCPSPRFP